MYNKINGIIIATLATIAAGILHHVNDIADFITIAFKL